VPICRTWAFRFPATRHVVGKVCSRRSSVTDSGRLLQWNGPRGRTWLGGDCPGWLVLRELEQERPIPASLAEEWKAAARLV